MKQGRASRDVKESWKVEPKAKAVSPGGVADMGTMKGNHSSEGGDIQGYTSRPLYAGRGYNAPGPGAGASGVGGGRTIYRSGSQRGK